MSNILISCSIQLNYTNSNKQILALTLRVRDCRLNSAKIENDRSYVIIASTDMYQPIRERRTVSASVPQFRTAVDDESRE